MSEQKTSEYVKQLYEKYNKANEVNADMDALSFAEEIANQIPALLAELESPWISVKDRLPEDKVIVHGVVFGKLVFTYYDYENEGWSQSKYYWYPEDEAPTHWMPLPNPPEVE